MKRWCGVDSCSGYQSNFDIDTRCPRTSVENRFVYSRESGKNTKYLKKLSLKVVLNCGACFLKTFEYANLYFHLKPKLVKHS